MKRGKKREARNNQFTCQQSSLLACLINCISIKFKLISAKLDITLIPITDDNLRLMSRAFYSEMWNERFTKN
jgi:hypothetical protein